MDKVLAIICIVICFVEIVYCIIQWEIAALILFIVGAVIWIYNLTQMDK